MKVQPNDVRFGVLRLKDNKLVVANLATREQAQNEAASRAGCEDIGYIRSGRSANHMARKPTPVPTKEY